MCIDKKNFKEQNVNMDETIIFKMLSAVIDQLDQIRNLITPKQTLEAAEALELAEKGLCCYCKEPFRPKEPKTRGCHRKCHRKINRAVHSGVISDQQAVDRGWILPAGKGGRKFSEDEPLGEITRLQPHNKND